MAREVFDLWITSEYERGNPRPDLVVYDGGEFWPQGLKVVPVGPDGRRDLTAEQAAARLGVRGSGWPEAASINSPGSARWAGRPRKEPVAVAD